MNEHKIGLLCDKCKKVVVIDEDQKYGHFIVREKRARLGTKEEPIKEKTVLKFEHCLCPACYSEYLMWTKHDISTKDAG